MDMAKASELTLSIWCIIFTSEPQHTTTSPDPPTMNKLVTLRTLIASNLVTALVIAMLTWVASTQTAKQRNQALVREFGKALQEMEAINRQPVPPMTIPALPESVTGKPRKVSAKEAFTGGKKPVEQ